MKHNFSRNKDGVDYTNLGCGEKTFTKVIEEVIEEMNWGGKFDFTDNSVKITVKVFGCVDTTVIEGSNDEISFIKELVENKGQLVAFFTRKMGITPNTTIFKLDTLLAAFDLYTQGYNKDDIQELMEIQLPTKPSKVKPTHEEIIDEVNAWTNSPLVKNLDSDDGVRHLGSSFIINKLIQNP